jgi:hypothetical protein
MQVPAVGGASEQPLGHHRAALIADAHEQHLAHAAPSVDRAASDMRPRPTFDQQQPALVAA